VKPVHSINHPIGEQEHVNHSSQADQQQRQRGHSDARHRAPQQQPVQQVARNQCRQQVQKGVTDRGRQRPQCYRERAVALVIGEGADVQQHPQSSQEKKALDAVASGQLGHWGHRHPSA
jgi:hypothetical protein